jgi:hypothetical protein
VLWPCIEHQYRANVSVVGEDREHSPLRTMIEVKEAVPGEDAIEAPTKGQTPHVGEDPFLMSTIVNAEPLPCLSP